MYVCIYVYIYNYTLVITLGHNLEGLNNRQYRRKWLC